MRVGGVELACGGQSPEERLLRLAGVEEAVEGGAADAEHVGSADLVTAGAGEDAGNVPEDGTVEIGVFGGGVGGGIGGGGGPVEAGDIEGADPLAWAIEGGGSDGRFEFADVAGPGVGEQAAERAGSEATERLPMADAPVTQEEGSEQRDIFTAVAQGRKEEADGGEVVGEVGAEGAGGGQAAERLGRADDDLERPGDGVHAEALMGGALEEVTQVALEAGVELVDAGEIEEAGAGFSPEGFGGLEEFGGEKGSKGSGGSGSDLAQSLGGEEFA